MPDIVTVQLDGEAVALSHYTVGPANVSFRDQVAALVFARVAGKYAELPGVPGASGDPPARVAEAAVALADALVAELVRHRLKGGAECRAA